MMRLLLAEDEPHLNNSLTKRLIQAHYTVDCCFNGQDALDYALATEYDALILDIMMPKLDGLSVLRKLREQQIATPILLLTAKDDIEDRVAGLDAGADDYLVKPFAFDELLARLRVMTRRQTAHVTNIFTLANLTVDCNQHLVYRQDKAITLSSKEFAILEYMIRHQGTVLSRDKIEQHVWNYDYMGDSNVVDVYIRYLRKKIDMGYEPKLIHTIRNVGYVLKVNE